MRAAEAAIFEVFLATDKNIRYQQNLAERVIAIVVLGNSRWPVVQRYVDRVVAAVGAAKPGTYYEVEIPDQDALRGQKSYPPSELDTDFLISAQVTNQMEPSHATKVDGLSVDGGEDLSVLREVRATLDVV